MRPAVPGTTSGRCVGQKSRRGRPRRPTMRRPSCHRRSLFALPAALLLVTASRAAAQAPGDVISELKISQTSGGFTGVLHEDDRFGGAVARVGDLDGDGHDDLLVA